MKILFYIVILINLFGIQINAQEKTGCTTEGCHISLISKSNIHLVILDDCFTCHEGDETNHPIGQGNEYKLSENSPSLCYICHNDISVNEKTKSVHPPFEEDCIN
ncbi:MAG: cytochrome c3 family protein, partial [Ignavibacteria bacterium]|nr:cytochrome c3 family protein [Ignavibacteria bacterium]